MATVMKRKWRRNRFGVKAVSSDYLQLCTFVLGKLAGFLVGRVELGPPVLGAVPVDVGCKTVTLIGFCGMWRRTNILLKSPTWSKAADPPPPHPTPPTLEQGRSGPARTADLTWSREAAAQVRTCHQPDWSRWRRTQASAPGSPPEATWSRSWGSSGGQYGRANQRGRKNCPSWCRPAPMMNISPLSKQMVPPPKSKHREDRPRIC